MGGAVKDVEAICKRYCERLREKRKLLSSYARATEKLKDALVSEDVERVTLHIKERQWVIERIASVDKGIGEIMEEHSSLLATLSGKARKSVNDSVKDVKKELDSMAKLELECVAMARGQHESIKGDILKARKGLHVAKGYRGKSPQQPRFLDMRR